MNISQYLMNSFACVQSFVSFHQTKAFVQPTTTVIVQNYSFRTNSFALHLNSCILPPALFPDKQLTFLLSFGHFKNDTFTQGLRRVTKIIASSPNNKLFSSAWWYIPIIVAPQKLKQEESNFQTSLCYIILNKIKNKSLSLFEMGSVMHRNLSTGSSKRL